jgi:hypothetical protein
MGFGIKKYTTQVIGDYELTHSSETYQPTGIIR